VVSTRPARASDGERLQAIDLATWAPSVSPAPAPDPTRRFFGNGHSAGDVIVAEIEGRVVGYVSLHQGLSIPSHDHVLEIDGLAVDPADQGRGVGRALVDAAQREAGRRGARKLSLRVLGPNAAARRLYEACGFVTEGVLVGEFRLDGVYVDDLLMACRVDGG
jgi:ribosomal protein S18 acetylase RimI-like enzyme